MCVLPALARDKIGIITAQAVDGLPHGCRQCIAYSLVNCVSESQHNWHIRASSCEVELIYCMNMNRIVYRGWGVELLEPLAS